MSLDQARRELLDLGLRNPLLNYRPWRARGLTITGENPTDLYSLLVTEGVAMDFLEATPQPPSPHGQPRASHTDHHLQTSHDAADLQKRLLATEYIGRTYLDEQGANVLYLALGFLHWYENDTAETPRRAPLILLPVELARASAHERFYLRFTGAEISPNLSLLAKCQQDFHLSLPTFGEEETLDVAAYFTAVQRAIAPQPRWQVDATAVALGFFTFDKLLIYRDLDPAHWPATADPTQHPILRRLLDEQASFPPLAAPDSAPAAQYLVLDADSSQLQAIGHALDGRNLVIQGPPGTGKSQTIANLIAEAVGRGRTVLFVSEKMAALEVVKRRLDGVGLGDAVLELHSHKSTKATFAAEIGRTLALGQPKQDGRFPQLAQLQTLTAQLAAHHRQRNTPVGTSALTPHELYGHLLRLRPHLPATLPPLPLPGMSAWSAAQFATHSTQVADLQRLLQPIGVPAHHPFAAAPLTALQPDHVARAQHAHQHALTALAQLQQTAAPLSAELAAPPPTTLPELEALLAGGQHLLTAPNLFAVQAAAAEWFTAAPSLATALENGLRLAALHQQYDEWLIPAAWEQDVFPLRQPLITHGSRALRFLSGDYRRAKAQLVGLGRPQLPDDPALHVALVDAILEAQQIHPHLAQHEPLLRQLLGQRWQGVGQTKWGEITAVGHWLMALHGAVHAGEYPPALLAYLGRGFDHTRRDQLAQQVAALAAAWRTYSEANAALAALQLPPTAASFTDLQAQLQQRHDAAESLPAWVALHQHAAELTAAGLAPLLTAMWDWPSAPHHVEAWLAFEYYTAVLGLVDAQKDATPETNLPISQSPTPAPDFPTLDSAWLTHNQWRLAHQHWQQLPPYEAAGQVGLLLAESAKKRGQRPIRAIMAQAATAVQHIKPIFMMSPLSIATFLPPGAAVFDMVIFDEASQVRPVDAFGALLRGRQAIIVGDSQQMPPTSFFERLVGNAAGEQGGGGAEEQEQEEWLMANGQWSMVNGQSAIRNPQSSPESILDLFLARQAPQSWLRWHYRSRHESLIATSNQLFYNNQLVLFPSPDASRTAVGLRLHHLPHTAYERGRSRTNPLEAQAVAEAVLHHARTTPHLTLGVATFSTAQREAIAEALETLRRADSTAEPFFAAHPSEPFFIKNLENVQGDERDVMLISVGYGRDEQGKITLNFGPLNSAGGERRLNVLITRARQQCLLFTNLRAADLDLRRTTAVGLHALHAYLQLAETGQTDAPAPTHPRPLTPFEAVVQGVLQAAGYSATPRLGHYGVVLDLAVRDPHNHGRYLLGVISDGPTALPQTVRDRERIQPTVLRGLGWHLHHVDSAAWWANPTAAADHLLAALTAAPSPTTTTATPPTVIQRYAAVPRGLHPLPPYQRAALTVNLSQRAGWRQGNSTAELISTVYYAYDPARRQLLAESVSYAFIFEKHYSGGAELLVVGTRVPGQIYHQLHYNMVTGEIKPYGWAYWVNETHQCPLRLVPATRQFSVERTGPPASYDPLTGMVSAGHGTPNPTADSLFSPELVAHVRQEAQWVAEIVETEGPIHPEELARALATAVGLTRRSTVMDALAATAAEYAAERGLIRQQGGFWWPAERHTAPPRQRGDLPAVSRKLDWVADEELLAAVDVAVGDALAMHPREAPAPVGALLGFGGLGAANHERILRLIAAALAEGHFVVQGDLIRLPRPGESTTAVTDAAHLREWLGLPDQQTAPEPEPAEPRPLAPPYTIAPAPNLLGLFNTGWRYEQAHKVWHSFYWYRWEEGIYTAETLDTPVKTMADFLPAWSTVTGLGSEQQLYGKLSYDPATGTVLTRNIFLVRVRRLGRSDLFYRLWRNPETGEFFGRRAGKGRVDATFGHGQVRYNPAQNQLDWHLEPQRTSYAFHSAAVDPALLAPLQAAEQMLLQTVLTVEAPIHLEELQRRFTEGAPFKGRSSWLDGCVARLVRDAAVAGQLQQRGDFIWTAAAPRPVPRLRSALPPVSRSLLYVPPEEVAEAIWGLLPLATAAVPPAVAQFLLGTERLPTAEAAVVQEVVAWLVEQGYAAEEAGQLVPVAAQIDWQATPYPIPIPPAAETAVEPVAPPAAVPLPSLRINSYALHPAWPKSPEGAVLRSKGRLAWDAAQGCFVPLAELPDAPRQEHVRFDLVSGRFLNGRPNSAGEVAVSAAVAQEVQSVVVGWLTQIIEEVGPLDEGDLATALAHAAGYKVRPPHITGMARWGRQLLIANG